MIQEDEACSRVGVAVIHWRAPERLADTLAALQTSERVDLQILVIDNASPEPDVRQVAESVGAVGASLMRLDENAGFVGGANAGLTELLASDHDYEFLAVCAHDVVVEPDTLAAIILSMQRNPTVGIAGPVFPNAVEGWDSRHASLRTWHQPAFPRLGPGVAVSGWRTGALLVFRRQCLEGIGLFDERLFAYCEDVDICTRAWRRGWAVASVEGARARDMGSTIGRRGHSYLIARNSLLLARWHEGPAYFAVASLRKLIAVIRSGIGAMLPWRSSSQRRLSRTFFSSQRHALVDAVLGRVGRPRSGLLG